MAHGENYGIPKLVKEEDDQDKCYQILLENIDVIRAFYRLT